MTKQWALDDLKKVNTEWQNHNAYDLPKALNVLDALVAYVLADDDEPTKEQPTEWYRTLPDNTPVEVKDEYDFAWSLRYVHSGKLYTGRHCQTPWSNFDDWKDIRWPLPPDGWALAHEQGRTHLILSAEGATWLTGNPELYIVGEDTVAAIVPIPEADHE